MTFLAEVEHEWNVKAVVTILVVNAHNAAMLMSIFCLL